MSGHGLTIDRKKENDLRKLPIRLAIVDGKTDFLGQEVRTKLGS